MTKQLRVVTDGERVEEPLSLMEAVEAGDILAIMRAQRRIIAESLSKAAENTKPQFSNELNKLNVLIAEEEARRSVVDQEKSVVAPLEIQAWDGTGY